MLTAISSSMTVFLNVVKIKLEESLKEFRLHFVIYITGMGIQLSRDGVIRGDEHIFQKIVREEKIPMVMLMRTLEFLPILE